MPAHKAEAQRTSPPLSSTDASILLSTPPLTSCGHFRSRWSDPRQRNITASFLHASVNTRAVHLEMTADYATMEFMPSSLQVFSIRGFPAVMLSDNGSQMTSAATEISDMVKTWRRSAAIILWGKGYTMDVYYPWGAHQNGYADVFVKSCKKSLKKAIDEQAFTPLKHYTCLLEVTNLVNQHPISLLRWADTRGHVAATRKLV